jgi:hypothetical protein
MSLIQKYYCVVEIVSEQSFKARIIDLDETIECKFDEVEEAELPLVKPGATFYWLIGRYGRRIASFQPLDRNNKSKDETEKWQSQQSAKKRKS